VNVIAPSVGIETAFVGSMEPQIINGTRNALTPSHVEFKGGFIGTETEIPSERSSERNERALIGAFGAGYTRSITPLKLIGYRAEELLQVK
jgi:hypothetical protein